jgi:CRISPR-associated protein Cmr1
MGFNISRYKETIKREFEVEVVTPMFLGGANTNEAELRTPSLKGMLRFWWRATRGIHNIQKLKEEEAELFGDTTCKSLTKISIEPIGNLTISKDLKTRGETFIVHGKPVHILDYLAYGTYTYEKGKGNVYHKEHILPGNRFHLKIECLEKHMKEVLSALAWMIHYGGIGARSRNGFGSLSAEIERPNIKNSLDIANYTALSKQSRLFLFPKKDSWHTAHSQAGKAYREARLSIESLHQYNRRKLISAPITVNKKNVADLERHSKPYFLHVRKLDDKRYQGQILYIPYNYLHEQSNDAGNKFTEYKKACEAMNKKLKELSGVANDV